MGLVVFRTDASPRTCGLNQSTRRGVSRRSILRVYDPSETLKGYPPNWKAISSKVRDASGHRCACCLHPFRRGSQGAWSPCDGFCTHNGPTRPIASDGNVLVPAGIEAHWRVLTIHHIDGNKLDCRWWNLVALCQRDHLRFQKTSGPFLPVQPWALPYIAARNAFEVLGEELTRPQATGRLEGLLVLRN